MERDGGTHSPEFPRPGLHPHVGANEFAREEPDGRLLDCNRIWFGRRAVHGVLDHRLPGCTTRALGKGCTLGKAGADYWFLLQNGRAANCDSSRSFRPCSPAMAPGSRKPGTARTIQVRRCPAFDARALLWSWLDGLRDYGTGCRIHGRHGRKRERFRDGMDV